MGEGSADAPREISAFDLVNRFKFHPATPTTGPLHDLVRQLHLELAEKLQGICPPGRELSTAITKLEESMMWSNAAIARGWMPIAETVQKTTKDDVKKLLVPYALDHEGNFRMSEFMRETEIAVGRGDPRTTIARAADELVDEGILLNGVAPGSGQHRVLGIGDREAAEAWIKENIA